MVERAQLVTVLSPPDSSLAAALRTTLALRGWTVAPRAEEGGGPPSADVHGVVVVLEDDAGRPLATTPPTGGSPRWICVGSLRSAARLAVWVARGAVVVNQDVPFLPLVQRVETALSDPSVGRVRSAAVVATAVQRRAAEAAALARLTERERTVLCGLVRGASALDIARDGSRSLPTIRSQIQAVLRQLGVTSQVAAVAVANRSGAHAGLGACLEANHQF